MPAITSQNLVLGLALILTIVGIAGLAPGLLDTFRRRRLMTHLAELDLDDEGDAGKPADEERLDEVDLLQRRVQAMIPTASREPASGAHVTQPAPAYRTEAPPPRALPLAEIGPVVDAEPVSEEGPVEEEYSPTMTVEDSAEAGDADKAETDGVQAAPEDGDDNDEDEDDILAMFKDTKLRSSAPEALADSIEAVAASDLLAQARELRDMLRRAA